MLQGDASQAASWLRDGGMRPSLVVADPPYGDILPAKWDRADVAEWVNIVGHFEELGAPPQYWWGGIGKPRLRHFFNFVLEVERLTCYRMRDLITWKKVRAYGKATDYLFCREELALFTLAGRPPPVFNVPYLPEKRGYAGFDPKYPAKSEYKRRSNVWVETELLRGKLHVAQKAPAVARIPIEVNTNPGDLVVDLYSGSGETAVQALQLGRAVVSVERDPATAQAVAKRLGMIIDEPRTPAKITPDDHQRRPARRAGGSAAPASGLPEAPRRRPKA